MKERINTLDFFRGLAVLNMLIFHGLYDLVYIFQRDLAWYRSPIASLWQNYIAISFVVIGGFSTNLSSNKKKNSLMVLLAGLLVSFVTIYILKDQEIYFGVLHMLGLSGLILLYLEPGLRRLRPGYLGLISLLIFIVSKNISRGYLGFLGRRIYLPPSIYKWKLGFILGLPRDSFASSDYFPLIPWFFLYLFGACLGRLYIDGKFSLGNLRLPLINSIGRHSLVVYLLHQPILYFSLYLFLEIL